MTSYLDQINNPNDLKSLTLTELKKLKKEVRKLVLNKVSKYGGHVGSNLGVVEMTIALHYVFNSPHDKIVFDVSHQTYPHKILTGRKTGFLDNQFDTISGYSDPNESPHDHFIIGHTSTSISLGLGLAKAREVLKEEYNVISIIGDGSLSGGVAFEGFDNAAVFEGNYIIIINDNEMCIAENHGGLYGNLNELRRTKGRSKNNFFRNLGLDYRYLEKGHDIKKLIELFKEAKDIDHPIVLHIHTEKGHGYKYAVQDKERWHWAHPFNLETGEPIVKKLHDGDYIDIIHRTLDAFIENGSPIIAINAATPGVARLKTFASKYPDRYIDAGIAEEFTITYAAGLAKGGVKPIVFHSSTFIQRAYDQLSHDLALNNLPVVILVFGGSISSGSPTHIGDFDIPLISNIPNIIYLAPASKEELRSMLCASLIQNEHPIVIRVPDGLPVSRKCEEFVFSEKPNWEVISKGEKTAIIGLGEMLGYASEISAYIKQQLGYESSVINPRYITSINKDDLLNLARTHENIIVLEAGCLSGGYGDKILRLLVNQNVKVYSYGSFREFHNGSKTELLKRFGMSKEQILKDIQDY